MTERARHILILMALGLAVFLPGLASLPVIDRDEARYAQSTVQMVETDDYIDIRFQDEPRYKKPVGAYWAQVAGLAVTGQLDDVRAGGRPIWAQRLPSVVGALLAVLFTYWAGVRLFGPRAALAGAAFLAVSVSLVFEAHQAKTDAMLAGASAAVLWGWVSARPWGVWLGLAAGVLLKGPVIVGVAGLAWASWWGINLLLPLGGGGGPAGVEGGMRNSPSARPHTPSDLAPLGHLPLRGGGHVLPLLTAIILTLPWFVAIGFISDGAFYAEALGRDFGAKLGSAQETHGGPPGYYALTTLVMFWPGVIALPLACVWAWKQRRTPAVALLLCWLVPMWIALELVPTKLPHYTLPLYPALALLCGAAVVETAKSHRLGLRIRLVCGLVFLPVALAVCAGIVTLPFAISAAVFTPPGDVTPYRGSPRSLRISVLLAGVAFVAIATALAGFVMAQFLRHRRIWPVAASGIASSLVLFGMGSRFVQSGGLYMAKDIAAELPGKARLVSPDFREPSLVYLAGTDTGLSADSLRAGDHLFLGGYGGDAPACAKRGSSVSGINYAKGQFLLGAVFTTDACDAAELGTWRTRQAARATDGGS